MKAIRRILAEPGTPVSDVWRWPDCSAWPQRPRPSGSWPDRAISSDAPPSAPGSSALVGILAAVEVLAFLRGPLRYAERLVGHDAALRALARWRVWLYDCLTPRVPAALSGWRSGDLLASAIDDVDTLQDLYLRTLLPLGIAVGAATLGPRGGRARTSRRRDRPRYSPCRGGHGAPAPGLAQRRRRCGSRARRRAFGPGRRRHPRRSRSPGLRRRCAPCSTASRR